MSAETAHARAMETVAYLKQLAPGFEPEIGVVLGSGLGEFAQAVEEVASASYEDVPHLKPCHVAGHAGKMILGKVGGKQLLCQAGRYHYYEGHTMEEAVFPVRVMAGWGIKTFVVTNAAGGIRTDFGPGTIMAIEDHINMMGSNPLRGANEDDFGPRFPDMSYAYDPEYRRKLQQVADALGLSIQKGVYMAVSGPSYETPAEIRAFRTLGADAVGMSTVPEVIAANHAGMRVLGISCISNPAAGMSEERLDHSDVKAAANKMGADFNRLLSTWIGQL